METLIVVGKVAAGVAGIVWVFWFPLTVWRAQQKNKHLHRLSVEELKALARRKPVFHCNSVLRELRLRGEDIQFSLPILLKMTLTPWPAEQVLGWSGLKEHFADELPDIDFSKAKPSREEREWMQVILDEVEG